VLKTTVLPAFIQDSVGETSQSNEDRERERNKQSAKKRKGCNEEIRVGGKAVTEPEAKAVHSLWRVIRGRMHLMSQWQGVGT
jgi:hypothetical protein